MNKIEENKMYRDAIQYLIEMQAYFEGYEYFKKELWRKVKGRKHTDCREVRIFFTHLWLHTKFPDIWTSVCGGGWCTLWNGEDPDGTPWTNYRDNPVTNYFKEYEDIQKDFAKWQYDDYIKRR